LNIMSWLYIFCFTWPFFRSFREHSLLEPLKIHRFASYCNSQFSLTTWY